MDEILWFDHSNETSSAVLSHGTIYLVCSSNFWVCGWNPMVLPFKWNLFSSIFTWFQTVEIKPVVFADGQENYWLWYSASHHQKNTTCPEKNRNIKINKGAPPNASVGWGARNRLSLACVQTPLPSDFSWGEGGSVHRLTLLYPVMKCFIFF